MFLILPTYPNHMSTKAIVNLRMFSSIGTEAHKLRESESAKNTKQNPIVTVTTTTILLLTLTPTQYQCNWRWIWRNKNKNNKSLQNSTELYRVWLCWAGSEWNKLIFISCLFFFIVVIVMFIASGGIDSICCWCCMCELLLKIKGANLFLRFLFFFFFCLLLNVSSTKNKSNNRWAYPRREIEMWRNDGIYSSDKRIEACCRIFMG